jgi:ribose transport system permease protein
MNNQTNNMGLAVAIGLGIGMVIGLINGLIITKLKINAFIATLGMSLVLQGVLYSSFDNYAGKVPEAFQTLAYGIIPIFGVQVPLGVYLLLIVAFVAFLILRFTRFGYHAYAVGGNVEVTRLSGVRTDRVIILAHILTGLGVALAAVVLIARLRSGGPRVGEGYDLDSIAAVVLGGTPLIGGKGGVWGTIAGVLIVSILSTIFNVLNVGAFTQDVLRGIVLIIVVAIYSYRRTR